MNYFIYIVTNQSKTVLYIGVTNSLQRRLNEHFENRGKSKTFAGRYACYSLLHWEHFHRILDAINREKELKKWSRKKKESLINKNNPQWLFLNKQIWSH
jgi:putative endonuclease